MNNFNNMRRYWPLLGIFAPLIGYSPVATTAILDVGVATTCGIQIDDTLNCFGFYYRNDARRLEIPKKFPPPFSQVSLGYLQVCAIRRDDGSLICDGSKKSGSFSQISVAPFHSCGLHTDGSVECWKSETETPDYGQAVSPAGTFLQVSVGRLHTCGLRPDQTVTCWGNNRYHQTEVPNETFSQISAAKLGWHTCGIRTTDQTLVCWGLNDHGQATPPPGPFSQVSAGKWYTCGIRADDQTIACWGGNEDGQAVPPSGRFSYVSAGIDHTCAIQADNHAPVCWGYDVYDDVKGISGDTLPLKRTE